MYQKQTWRNLPDQTTPLSADRLNHLETQYESAVEYVNDASETIKEQAVNQSKDYTDLKISEIPSSPIDLVSGIRYPLYISHRGAPLCYPEHSIEGYRASYESGFSPEADVVALADGTPVCIHDTTTNRTMDIQKPVNSVTVDEWRNATINPPSHPGRITGSGRGTPVFFEDYLDEFGGKIPLFPEIKDQGVTSRVIHEVVRRGLQKSVVLQSSSLAVLRQVKEAGIYALMLGTSQQPEDLSAEGIEFVSVNRNTPQSFISDCISNGLKVIGYTHNTLSDANDAFSKGMVGVFSDDPWEVSRERLYSTSLDLSKGTIPPASQFSRRDFTGADNPVTTNFFSVQNDSFMHMGIDPTAGGLGSVKLGSFGYGGPTAKLQFWAQALGTAASEVSWIAGIYLGHQPGWESINEIPDSKFRLGIIRRDGRKAIFNKPTPGGSTDLLGSTSAPSTPYAPPGGRSSPMKFEVEFTPTSVTIRNLSLNDPDITESHPVWSGEDLYLCLAVNGSYSNIWGVTCVR